MKCPQKNQRHAQQKHEPQPFYFTVLSFILLQSGSFPTPNSQLGSLNYVATAVFSQKYAPTGPPLAQNTQIVITLRILKTFSIFKKKIIESYVVHG